MYESMKDAVLFLFFIFIYSVSATEYSCDPALACGCSKASTVVTSRIVGGETAAKHAWGWMISVHTPDRFLCGASLLSSEYAVTTASCVTQSQTTQSTFFIQVGTNHLNTSFHRTAQRRTVMKIILPPDYDSNPITNNIAIIQFSPLTIPANSKLAFICLPESNEDPFQIKDNLVALGWGHTDEYSTSISSSLRQVTLRAYSSTSVPCLRSGLIDSHLQFCAGDISGDKDTCIGDGGGPLMAFVNNRWVLAGITSYGRGCAEAGYLGVYTRVSAFVEFIQSMINQTDSTTMTDLAITTSTDQSIFINWYLNWNGGDTLNISIFAYIFSYFLFVLQLFFY